MDDGLGGANFGAVATVDAGVCVDLVDVAFRDRFGRALVDASTASDASILDKMCHNLFGAVNGVNSKSSNKNSR